MNAEGQIIMADLSVVIVDDHPIFREGLVRLVAERFDADVRGFILVGILVGIWI